MPAAKCDAAEAPLDNSYVVKYTQDAGTLTANVKEKPRYSPRTPSARSSDLSAAGSEGGGDAAWIRALSVSSGCVGTRANAPASAEASMIRGVLGCGASAIFSLNVKGSVFTERRSRSARHTSRVELRGRGVRLPVSLYA